MDGPAAGHDQRDAVGKTAQAVEEAHGAGAGLSAVLLSLAAPCMGASEDEQRAWLSSVAKEMPLIGFYLQTAVGDIPLSRGFWARFAAIDNVVAIKVAPFNLIARSMSASALPAPRPRNASRSTPATTINCRRSRDADVVVRTGNREVTLRFKGGLPGHWSVWTRGAAKMLERLKLSVSAGAIPPEVLALDSFVTDTIASCSTVEHDFTGCNTGCHEDPAATGLAQVDRVPRSAREAQSRPERRHPPALCDLS